MRRIASPAGAEAVPVSVVWLLPVSPPRKGLAYKPRTDERTYAFEIVGQ